MNKHSMTKEKIKELLNGVYAGWKDIDDVVDEIYESFNELYLPPMKEKKEDSESTNYTLE